MSEDLATDNCDTTDDYDTDDVYDTDDYDTDDDYDTGDGRYLPARVVVDGEIVDEDGPWDLDIFEVDDAIEVWEPDPLDPPDGPVTSDSAPASGGGGALSLGGGKIDRRRGGRRRFGFGEDLDVDEADEVILDLLDAARNAEELDPQQIHDLGLLLGDQRAGAALGRALNKEARQARGRRPKRRRGFWHWFAGPIHEQGDPIPDGVAAVLLRIQEGRPLDWQDFKRLGAVIGRRSVRLLESLIHGAMDRDQHRGRGGRR